MQPSTNAESKLILEGIAEWKHLESISPGAHRIFTYTSRTGHVYTTKEMPISGEICEKILLESNFDFSLVMTKELVSLAFGGINAESSSGNSYNLSIGPHGPLVTFKTFGPNGYEYLFSINRMESDVIRIKTEKSNKLHRGSVRFGFTCRN
jgi:hypothetical protein